MQEPITLYLQLERSTAPDLEVVARASLAWAALLRELAFVTNPDAQIRIELASTTEGSLGIDTLIRGLRNLTKKDLRAIAVGAGSFLALETASYAYEHLLDSITDADDEHTLTDADLARIAEVMSKGTARKQAEHLFAEIERDPNITGVGVSRQPGEVPAHIIPRSQFLGKAGFAPTFIETAERRHTPVRYEALLIKPVLVLGSRRRWRLLTADGEQSFIMRDDQFVADVLSGARVVPMVAGLVMDIEVMRTEDFRDGVWTVTEQSIQRVRGYRRPDLTGLLDLGLVPKSDEDDDQD